MLSEDKAPKRCEDCRFLEERKDPHAWPYICVLDETEVVKIEKPQKDCPLRLNF